MRLAIVGTSHLSDNETSFARKAIVWKIREIQSGYSVPIEIVTGDADGIDKLVKEIGEQEGLKVIVKESRIKQWQGIGGFMSRNMEIVKEGDYFISISTPIKKQKCYHCNKGHERTGGCWVLRMARMKGKKGEVIVV